MEPVSDPRLYSNRYQVTHLIARGGMAMVYRAQDELLNRAVALKILYPELSADPLFVERFRREAQAAANLSHPNIVPVFDWGEDDGTYFIVMELIDGTSLAEMLRGGRTLTASRSAQLIAQVAAALGYAHRSGVVHRDVKPGNILITSDGQVKVTDFGIAQAVATEDQLAEAGSVMGTATYFSPEQAAGSSVDGRSDVYSLGVVLYEMLAGRPPFVGDAPVDVASQHVNDAVPPPTQFNDAIPRDLEAITMQALAKWPDQRYQSADEFRADLLRFSEGQPVHALGAGHDVAFLAADATRAVSTVMAGERTLAVPVMPGPRTDVRRRRRGRAGWIIVIVLVLLAAGGGAGYAYYASHRVVKVLVPSLYGQTVSVATQTLTSDGLAVGSTESVTSNEPLGTVVGTTPKAGTRVVKGHAVILQVSKGKPIPLVSIPNVVNMSLSAAETLLGQSNLNYHLEYTTTPPLTGANPNTVLSQTPVAGTKVRTGARIVLIVLNPASAFPMPSVRGQSPTQAASTLGQDGLTVSGATATRCSNTVQSGLVLATVPAAGSPVTPNTAVELITSSGYCQVVVPTVVGQTQSEANTTLNEQGLVLGQVTQADPASCASPGLSGTIATQSLAPGTLAPYDSSVDVTVCP